MTHMTTQARELAIAAYRAGEMDFEITPEGANLAAAHAHNSDPLIMAGKRIVDAAFTDAEKKDSLTEEQFEDLEYLVDLYSDYITDYVPARDDVNTDGWDASTADTLTAVYLLIQQHAEGMEIPHGGTETTHLLGELGTYIEKEAESLGEHDPQDLADELEATNHPE